jgi:hypothetical protein
MISVTPQPLYSQGNNSQYPLNKKLVGPQSRSGRCGKEKNLAVPGIEPGPSLFRLSYLDSILKLFLMKYGVKMWTGLIWLRIN